MNDADLRLLADSASEIFAEQCPPLVVAAAETDGWSAPLWRTLEETGFSRLGIPVSVGGAGGSLEEVATVLRVAASYAAPVPLAETLLLAGWLLGEAGIPCPDGPLTAAVLSPGRHSARVPYGRVAAAIVVLVERSTNASHVVVVDPAHYHVSPESDLAGIPRDLIDFEDLADLAHVPVGVSAEAFMLAGALARAIQLRGAMERVLTLSLEYAGMRRQFGVPIARFQAVQQLLSTIAGEGAAAGAAVDAAVRTPTPERIAVAKARTSEAAGIVAAAADQVHGAVGFTQEHHLHHVTRRLWTWRDEFGNERAHAEMVGRALAAAGPESLWEFVATSAGAPSNDDCLRPG